LLVVSAAVNTNLCVTPASQVVSQRPIHALRPASEAVLTQLGQEDQRIYRALHTLETCTIEALNNYSHRPRRTRNVLSQRVPFERKHENGRVAFREIDITAKCSPPQSKLATRSDSF
jgi:hypothetical protein